MIVEILMPTLMGKRMIEINVSSSNYYVHRKGTSFYRLWSKPTTTLLYKEQVLFSDYTYNTRLSDLFNIVRTHYITKNRKTKFIKI